MPSTTETPEGEQEPLIRESHKDLLTGMESSIPLHFGRPDWVKNFKYVKKENPDSEVGVFFCGPPVIGDQLASCCDQHSDSITTEEHVDEEGTVVKGQTGTNFLYFEEHF